MSRTESNLDELLAQQVVVGRLAERTVVVDGLVHHVPAVNLPFEVADDGLDVLDETRLQHLLGGRTGGIAVGEPPVGRLRVPDETVADDLQVVLLAVAHELVGHAEVEDTLCGSQCLGLHAVLGHGTVEVLVHHRVGLGHLSIALPLVDGSADETVFTDGVLQPLCRAGCCQEQQSCRNNQSTLHSCYAPQSSY